MKLLTTMSIGTAFGERDGCRQLSTLTGVHLHVRL